MRLLTASLSYVVSLLHASLCLTQNHGEIRDENIRVVKISWNLPAVMRVKGERSCRRSRLLSAWRFAVGCASDPFLGGNVIHPE